MNLFIKNTPKGQSAVEFVLIAPLLFFIFFAIIQLAYMAYVSLAVQRSALAVARDATLTGQEYSISFKSQLAISLLPLTNLNPRILSTILASDYALNYSPDRKTVAVQVKYPMPIWVPLIRNVIGENLESTQDYNQTTEGQAIKKAFELLGKPAPDLNFQKERLPVFWVTCQETTFNEGYNH